MARSTEYRRNAEDCLRLAERTGSPGTKSFLIMLAVAWHRLAQDLENITRPEISGHGSPLHLPPLDHRLADSRGRLIPKRWGR
jgi:hypothetical protein